MHRSFDILRFTQLARWHSAPLDRATSLTLGLESALEGLRQRNAALDWLFYDVGSIRPDEARLLSTRLAAEGDILFVPPSGAAGVQVCESVEAFVAEHAGQVTTLAVAGVGSSALGAAAFARNIADALGEPVAAVVSGYGLADLAAEALGGFLLFGAVNAVRHHFEWLDQLREARGLSARTGPSLGAAERALRSSKDTRTVLELLLCEELALDRLFGHSKGNLVISEALFALKDTAAARYVRVAARTRVTTLSAKIAMPAAFRTTLDIMGEIDSFGLLNSRPGIASEFSVPWAWHHTNTDLPFHLPVTSTLQQLLRAGRL